MEKEPQNLDIIKDDNYPNDMDNLDEKSQNEVKTNVKKKRKLKPRTKLLIIIVTVCVLVTTALILIKIKNIKDSQNKDEAQEKIEDAFVTNQTTKKQAEDLKYVCKSFNETYNQNDIEIKMINEGDSPEDYSLRKYTRISYIQISGLKNTDIQNKINNEIKDVARSMVKENVSGADTVNVYIGANFSNVLSLKVLKKSYKYKGDYEQDIVDQNVKCLNYNLVTGEKLHLEDLFVSSAPIASIVADATYNALAWDTDISFEMEKDELDKNTNMDRRDTSSYEDEMLIAVNKYKNKKDDLQFYFTETKLYIYDLVNKEVYFNDRMNLKLMDYMDNITIYKKYADNDIYTKDNIGMKNVYVYTYPLSCTKLTNHGNNIYGKLTNNFFADVENEEFKLVDNENVNKKITNDFSNRLNQIINGIKNKAISNSDKGYTYQSFLSYYVSDKDQEYMPYISININTCLAEMPRSTFDNELLKELAKNAVAPKASVEDMLLSEYYYDIEGLSSKFESKSYYYDLEGNYLGDNENVLKKREYNNIDNNSNDYDFSGVS